MTENLVRLITPTPEEVLLLESLRGGSVQPGSEDRARDFARVVWACITEPGDAVAVRLTDTLGDERALAHLIGGTSISNVLAEIRSCQGNEEVISGNMLRAALKRWKPRLDRAGILECLERAVANRMMLLLPYDDAWPRQIDDLQDHRPFVLWVRGRVDVLQKPALAIVGARSCTAYGQQVTADITEAAVNHGLVVVSGAAYGIDAVAHRATIASGGETIAVLAGGADMFYPREHTQLLESIMHHGAIVAETPPGTAPTRWRFLTRNRVIAALARATVITEAGYRSGSINTAGHAAELGRELAAVPGPITAVGSQGCFRIINEYGAHMLVRPSDVVSLIHPAAVSVDPELPREPSVHRRTIDALPLRGSRRVPDIAKRAGLGIEETLGSLIELELLGEARRASAGSPGDVAWKLVSRPG